MIALNRTVEGIKCNTAAYLIATVPPLILLAFIAMGYLDGVKALSALLRGGAVAVLILPVFGFIDDVTRPLRISYSLIIAGLICSGPNSFIENNPISTMGSGLALCGIMSAGLLFFLPILQGRIGSARTAQ